MKAGEAILNTPEATPADVAEVDAKLPELTLSPEYRSTVGSPIAKAEAGDPGAPFQAPALEALGAMCAQAPAEYMRVRARLKAVGVAMGELDRR
jgi:hypothetical protein